MVDAKALLMRPPIELSSLAPVSAWHLYRGSAINDNGYIVGHGFREGVGYHAYLPVPVPEPASLVALVTAIMTAGACGALKRGHR